jgi:hypothetical protein
MPDPSQFNTDRTYPGRWTITFSNPPIKLRSGGRTMKNGHAARLIVAWISELGPDVRHPPAPH